MNFPINAVLEIYMELVFITAVFARFYPNTGLVPVTKGD